MCIEEKILQGAELSKEELRDLAFEFDFNKSDLGRIKFVEEKEGVAKSWAFPMQTIFELDGKYYALNWEKSTESEAALFLNQPYEVFPQEKTVKVREWVRKEMDT